ncbi:MAG: enoyl-CoA hydratase [Candidatus Latescibacteria bacterium]|nr:enoyl-CoA hydratase [Candidatus Latescibacterota bacterium]NIM22114.1 enoyl-CoA hydratase [Candidatus Latescibacterota bacterium]NIM64664.1 enoyl-CoA hydratase [Candidatus Latescibacterota bacterium]NIO01174.1 enoyl-CoA hydratase [Candidatus Latescibacterota bacterium]NIO27559.1 enoyl-CoA hydratase [Candidatus Latescibacterota bacterium]
MVKSVWGVARTHPRAQTPGDWRSYRRSSYLQAGVPDIGCSREGGIGVELEYIRFEKRDQVAYISLNRPKVLNALNAATIEELEKAFKEAADDDGVRVMVLTGSGDKAFAAGADIAELAGKNAMSGAATAETGQHAFRLLEAMGKPSIAAVNGYALGGGCELAMACTIRIASEKARFGQPEVNLGLIPGYGGTQRLSRLVGKGIALDLILTGRTIDAQEALRIGLVSRVVPQEELMAAVNETAQSLLEKGPIALKAAREAIDRGFEMEFEDGCKLEASLFGLVCATDDMKEGTRAFLEKRKANFKGR